MKLTRIKKDADDVANILRDTTDSSTEQYMMEQQPNIQRMLETLRTLLCDETEATASPVAFHTTDSTPETKIHLSAQPNPTSERHAASISSEEAQKSSPVEIFRSGKAKESLDMESIRSLEAQLQHQRAMYITWGSSKHHSHAYIHQINV